MYGLLFILYLFSTVPMLKWLVGSDFGHLPSSPSRFFSMFSIELSSSPEQLKYIRTSQEYLSVTKTVVCNGLTCYFPELLEYFVITTPLPTLGIIASFQLRSVLTRQRQHIWSCKQLHIVT